MVNYWDFYKIYANFWPFYRLYVVLRTDILSHGVHVDAHIPRTRNTYPAKLGPPEQVLHPLLVSKMRNEPTRITTLDASLLPDSPDMPDGLLWRDGALEVWCEGGELTRKFHQALDLFRSGIRITAYLHHTRADTEEQHTILLVLRTEFGHNDIQSRLGGRV